jgi:tetratricopeptide (TPR) repeat protein
MQLRRVITIWLFFGFLSGVLILHAQAAEDAHMLYTKAQEAHWSFNLPEAIRLYTKVLEIDPKSARAHFNRGVAFRSSGDVDAALADFSQAIARDHGIWEALYGRGLILIEKQRYAEASQDLENVLKLVPGHAGVMLAMAKAQIALGKSDEAIKELKTVAQQFPEDPEVYYFRGLAYLENRSPDNALADLNRTVELNPRHSGAWHKIGNILVGKGNFTAALNAYEQAIKLDPANAALHNNQGWARAQQGNAEGALKDLSRALELDINFLPALTNRAAVLRNAGRLDEALADYSRLIDKGESNALVLAERGKILLEMGRPQDAAKDLESACKMAPDIPGIRALAGKAKLKAGRFKDAVADLDLALQKEPNNAAALVDRAGALDAQKRYPDVIRDLTRAIRIDPGAATADTYYDLAKAYLMTGDYDRSIEKFTEAITKQPSHGLAHANRGVAFRNKGQNAKAVEDFRKALQLLKDPSRQETIGRLLAETEAGLRANESQLKEPANTREPRQGDSGLQGGQLW